MNRWRFHEFTCCGSFSSHGWIGLRHINIARLRLFQFPWDHPEPQASNTHTHIHTQASVNARMQPNTHWNTCILTSWVCLLLDHCIPHPWGLSMNEHLYAYVQRRFYLPWVGSWLSQKTLRSFSKLTSLGEKTNRTTSVCPVKPGENDRKIIIWSFWYTHNGFKQLKPQFVGIVTKSQHLHILKCFIKCVGFYFF